jgi:hypothetical protein
MHVCMRACMYVCMCVFVCVSLSASVIFRIKTFYGRYDPSYASASVTDLVFTSPHLVSFPTQSVSHLITSYHELGS